MGKLDIISVTGIRAEAATIRRGFCLLKLAVALAVMFVNSGVHSTKSEELSVLLHVSKSGPLRTCRLLESTCCNRQLSA
jgi:hypothetical protein